MERRALVALALLAVSCAGDGERTETPPVNLKWFLARELAAGKKHIRIPPGRYRVEPENRQHLVFHDLQDVTITAAGVELVCAETTRAISIIKCRNFVIRGLTIDYDPLPYTQGRIESISNDGLVHEIELFDGYPRSGKVIAGKYEIFRADSRTLRFGSYYGFTVDTLSPSRIRITKPSHYRDHPEQVGDIIAINASDSPGGEIPHAVYAENCADLVLEDVTLYASNCFGFFEVGCDRSTYRRCRIDRRPPDDDPRPRADARIRSLNADAYHSRLARTGPAYLSCSARFQGDDCVAISGDYHMVTASAGRILRVLAKQGEINIRAGDQVEIVTYAGARLPNAAAVSVVPDGGSSDAEGEFLSRQHMHAPMKARQYGFLSKAYRIELDREVDLPIGSLVCSANRIGNGFKVADCDLGFNRSRGILVKAGHGEITGNRLEGCWMPAIILSPEYWWLEAGSGDAVVIRGNEIVNCLDRGIAVYASGGTGEAAPAGAHSNITITDNVVRGCPNPQIRVTSTRHLRIRDNDLRPADDAAAVELLNCEDVDSDQP